MDKQLAHYTSASASATIDTVVSGMNSIYTSISDLEVTTTNVILSLGFVTLVISPFIFTWYLDTKNYNDNTTEDLMDETISILENLEKSKIPELDPYKGIEICLTNFKSFLVKEGPSKFLQLEEPVSEELSQYKGIFLTNFNSKSKSFLVKEGPSNFLQLEEPVLEELSQQEIEGLTQQELEEPQLEGLTQQEKFLNDLKENLISKVTSQEKNSLIHKYVSELRDEENLIRDMLNCLYLDAEYQKRMVDESLKNLNKKGIMENLTTKFNHETAEDIFDILQHILCMDLVAKKVHLKCAHNNLTYWKNLSLDSRNNIGVADELWNIASNNNQIFNSMDQNELKELNELERTMHVNYDCAKEALNELVNTLSVEDIANIKSNLRDILTSIGNSVEKSKGEISKNLIQEVMGSEIVDKQFHIAWDCLNTIYNLGEIPQVSEVLVNLIEIEAPQSEIEESENINSEFIFSDSETLSPTLYSSRLENILMEIKLKEEFILSENIKNERIEKFLNDLKENLSSKVTSQEKNSLIHNYVSELRDEENLIRDMLNCLYLDAEYQKQMAAKREDILDYYEEAIMENLTTRFNHEIAEDIFDILLSIIRMDLDIKDAKSYCAKANLDYWEYFFNKYEGNSELADNVWVFAHENNKIFDSKFLLDIYVKPFKTNNNLAKEKLNKLVNSLSVEDIANIKINLEENLILIYNSIEAMKLESTHRVIDTLYPQIESDSSLEELGYSAWMFLDRMYDLSNPTQVSEVSKALIHLTKIKEPLLEILNQSKVEEPILDTFIINLPALKNKKLEFLLKDLASKEEKFNEALKQSKNQHDYLLNIYLNAKYQELLAYRRLDIFTKNFDILFDFLMKRDFIKKHIHNEEKITNYILFELQSDLNEEESMHEIRSSIYENSFNLLNERFKNLIQENLRLGKISDEVLRKIINDATEFWRENYPFIINDKVAFKRMNNPTNLQFIPPNESEEITREIADLHVVIMKASDIDIVKEKSADQVLEYIFPFPDDEIKDYTYSTNFLKMIYNLDSTNCPLTIKEIALIITTALENILI